ncbi:MAG: riboflavin synthase [Bellilinea sp.]
MALHRARKFVERKRSMFTGIIEEMGTVNRLRQTAQGVELSVISTKVHTDAQPGDSIAVNGACLTVTQLTVNGFTVELSPETRSRTNLVHIRDGDLVNLERSLLPTSRLGGHFVQGHVDGAGVIAGFRKEQDSLWVSVRAPEELMRYIVPKGFIALDGASLTVVDVGEDTFTVSLIAFTQQQITLPLKKLGDKINIEVDILGKYIVKMLSVRTCSPQSTKISMEFLAENGYR